MLEDRLLIRKCKQGDRSSFDRIYQKYLDELLTIAMHLLNDYALAEDVVQEVFVKFIQTLDTFKLRGSLKGFFACCVANRSRDLLRQKKRRPENTLEEKHDSGAPDSEPIMLLLKNEQMQQLQNGLDCLPYEQREVITLRHHGSMKFQSIADLQGVSIKTAQSRYSYGMEKLRTMLNGEVVK